MPPASAEVGNRIGLGVNIDDPGNSTLVYLREINIELSNIRNHARSIPATLRVAGEGQQRPAGQRKQEAVREAQDTAQAVTQIQTSQLHLFDQAHNTVVNNQIRRTKTLTEETRNAASQMKFSFDQAAQAQALPRLNPVLGPSANIRSGDTIDEAARAQDAARSLRERNNQFRATLRARGVAQDPMEAQRLRDLEDELAATGERLATRARVEGNRRYHPTRANQFYHANDEGTGSEEDAAQFEQRTIRRYLQSQQRRGIVTDYQREQQASKTVGQTLRESEVEKEQAAQNKVARKRLNEAINERARQIELEARENVRLDRSLITRTSENDRPYGPPRPFSREDPIDRRVAFAGDQVAKFAGREAPLVGKELSPQQLYREAASAQTAVNQLTGQFNRLEKAKAAGLDIRLEARRMREGLAGAHAEAHRLAVELEQPEGKRRAYGAIQKDLASLRGSINETRREASQLNNVLLNQGGGGGGFGGGGGGGGGPRSPEGGFGGPLSGQNFGFAAQRITRNLILYQAFSFLTRDLVEYTKAAVEAAKASDDLDRSIRSEAIQAQTASRVTFQSAEALRQKTGLSSIQARQVELAGLRFAEDDPTRAPQLTAAAVDLAASRGIKAEDTPEFLENLRQRNSRTYKKLLGTTTEDIYRKYAETEVDSGRGQKFENFGDYNEPFQTRYEAINKYLANMTEAQKAEATYNEVLRRGTLFTGEAAVRQEDLAGRLDRVSSRWQDAQQNVGMMILQIRPLNDLIENLAGALGRVDFSKFKGRGPQGTLAPDDLADFTKEYRESGAAKTSDFIEARLKRPRLLANQGIGTQGQGALILDLLGLGHGGYFANAIPGAGGDVSDYERQGDQIRTDFYEQMNAQKRQQSREGSGRYRLPGAQPGESLSREESLEKRAKGEDVSQYQYFVENDLERAARGVVERERKVAEANREQVARNASDEANERERDQKREAQELLNRQGAALAKIRENIAGSFQLVTKVGQGITGPDNPYVKLFSDGASAADRMRREFGHLGEATVQYFTDLENKGNALALMTLRFETLAQSGRNLVEARNLERNRGVGLTGNESRYRDAFGNAVTAATENPELYNRARFLQTGFRGALEPERQLREQFDNLRRTQTAFAGTAGLGPEAQDAIQGLIDKGVISLADKAGDSLARSPYLNYLRQGAIGAIRRTADRNNREVERAAQRVAIGAEATADTDRLIDQQRQLAQKMLAHGGDAKEAGRLLDRQILAISGAVPTSELSPKAYQGRIEALRREAVRGAEAEAEAQAAVQEGLRVQQNILANLEAIRSGILGGDMSLLIQIENDTKADVDAKKLKEMGKGLEPRGGLPTRTSQPGPPDTNSVTKFQ